MKEKKKEEEKEREKEKEKEGKKKKGHPPSKYGFLMTAAQTCLIAADLSIKIKPP